MDGNNFRLEVCGDSSVIVNWCNGIWPVKFLPYCRRVSRLQCQLHELVLFGSVHPREDSADFCRHVYRELNGRADAMANRHANSWNLPAYGRPAKCIRAFFDGSVKGIKAAFGWVVLGCHSGDDDMQLWSEVASKSGFLPDGATITAAELEGLSSLISFLHVYDQSYDRALSNIRAYSLMNCDIIRSLVLADLV